MGLPHFERIRGRNCDHSEMRTHSDFTATERGHNGSMGGLGRMLMVLGVVLIVVGVLVSFGERLPVRLGRLPGDIVWRGKNSVFYFPLMTSILLSVVLSAVLWLFGRMR